MGADTKPGMVVRADSSPEIGVGHVMRTLALAQEWILHGGRVTFVTNTTSQELVQRLIQSGAEVVELETALYGQEDLTTTLNHMTERQAEWLVLDGYEFDTQYQQGVKRAGRHFLMIDDCADRPHYYADVLLNQNLHAGGLPYSKEDYTVMLLGTQYALLRPEFAEWQNWTRSIPQVGRRVLVSLGGGDSVNFTLKALQALKGLDQDGLEVNAVIGSVNPNRDSLQAEISSWERHECSLSQDVSDMSRLMAWADLAVCSAGSSSWELAYMGLPALLTVIADNQTQVVDGSEEAGTIVKLGWHTQVTEQGLRDQLDTLLNDHETRTKMSVKGRKLVDGLGCKRVVDCLMSVNHGNMWPGSTAETDSCESYT